MVAPAAAVVPSVGFDQDARGRVGRDDSVQLQLHGRGRRRPRRLPTAARLGAAGPRGAPYWLAEGVAATRRLAEGRRDKAIENRDNRLKELEMKARIDMEQADVAAGVFRVTGS